MRLSLILPVFAVLFPTMLFAAGSRVAVHVTVRVPLIASVEGPAQVVLAPGESTRIHVGVMTNVPWILAIHSPNTSALQVSTLSGSPGSVAANSREVEICCSPDASGRQVIDLIYTLMPQ
jgi:hypothetical protein